MNEQYIGSYHCTYVRKSLDDCPDYSCFSILKTCDSGFHYESGLHLKRLGKTFEVISFDQCQESDDEEGDFVLMRISQFADLASAMTEFSNHMEKLDPEDFVKIDHFLHSSMFATKENNLVETLSQ